MLQRAKEKKPQRGKHIDDSINYTRSHLEENVRIPGNILKYACSVLDIGCYTGLSAIAWYEGTRSTSAQVRQRNTGFNDPPYSLNNKEPIN